MTNGLKSLLAAFLIHQQQASCNSRAVLWSFAEFLPLVCQDLCLDVGVFWF